jgi:hypothetical protein
LSLEVFFCDEITTLTDPETITLRKTLRRPSTPLTPTMLD